MKTITKGVMEVTEENGTFVFHRVSDAQMAIYKPNAGGWRRSPVLVLLPLWRGHEKTNKAFQIGTLPQVRDRIRVIAEKYPANRVVDCSGFIPPVADFFSDKGLHPNALGHTFYAQGLLPYVRELLK